MLKVRAARYLAEVPYMRLPAMAGIADKDLATTSGVQFEQRRQIGLPRTSRLAHIKRLDCRRRLSMTRTANTVMVRARTSPKPMALAASSTRHSIRRAIGDGRTAVQEAYPIITVWDSMTTYHLTTVAIDATAAALLRSRSRRLRYMAQHRARCAATPQPPSD